MNKQRNNSEEQRDISGISTTNSGNISGKKGTGSAGKPQRFTSASVPR
jgi:hypothetical protein